MKTRTTYDPDGRFLNSTQCADGASAPSRSMNELCNMLGESISILSDRSSDRGTCRTTTVTRPGSTDTAGEARTDRSPAPQANGGPNQPKPPTMHAATAVTRFNRQRGRVDVCSTRVSWSPGSPGSMPRRPESGGYVGPQYDTVKGGYRCSQGMVSAPGSRLLHSAGIAHGQQPVSQDDSRGRACHGSRRRWRANCSPAVAGRMDDEIAPTIVVKTFGAESRGNDAEASTNRAGGGRVGGWLLDVAVGSAAAIDRAERTCGPGQPLPGWSGDSGAGKPLQS